MQRQPTKGNDKQNETNKIMDLNSIKNWVSVGDGQISADGSFACYKVYNEFPGKQKLILQSLTNAWRDSMYNASGEQFTNDSKCFVYNQGLDSLVILDLSKHTKDVIFPIGEFKISSDVDARWLAFRNFQSPQSINVKNLKTNEITVVNNVTTFQFVPNNKLLVATNVTSDLTRIKIVDLRDKKEKLIWQGSQKIYSVKNIIVDENGLNILLVVETIGDKNILFYSYSLNVSRCEELLNDKNVTIRFPGYQISNSLPRFSHDSKHLLFKLQKIELTQKEKDGLKLDIWSYTDSVLQSKQLEEKGKKLTYTVILNLKTKNIIQAEEFNQKIKDETNDYILLEARNGLEGVFENAWNKSAQFNYYLLSLKDGSKKLIKGNIINPYGSLHLSPNGKWIIYYDFNEKSYFSYETETCITRNISKAINVNWENEDVDYPEPSLRGMPEFVNSGERIVVYDAYDVWTLDPAGIVPPINITNGYGRKSNIIFNLLGLDGKQMAKKKNRILLKAFDNGNKNFGFYSTTFNFGHDPELRCMGPYVYENWEDYSYIWPPIKAKNAEVYLGLRCSVNEAPNYFITRDFKHLNFISDYQPQRNFIWYTTELHSWKSLDGRTLKGILYKPQNFDSTKKYPVIFNYYERRSKDLNLFMRPSPSRHEINIPLFVSQGYLVFVPDIYFSIGHPGRSAYNSVVSAAHYLCTKHWVDSLKLGAQGHSFGGFETGYLITHTSIFAAACSASGIYDFIGWYGSDYRADYSKYHIERSQGRMGGAPWDMKDLYIENSSIFYVDRISTPLLMMHNKEDETVPFSQGVEFFTSLRRLGKKTWMLQYDDEGHSLNPNSSAAIDFHTRMLQFYDHYLKGKPAPKWMGNSVTASQNDVQNVK